MKAPHPLLTAGVVAGALDADVADEFAAAVHQCVREMRGRALGPVIPPGPGTNYYSVRVDLRGEAPLRLMLNVAIGLVGAADGAGRDELMAPFREVPRPDVFSLFGFRVARSADMEEPLVDDHARNLSDHERKDLAYHRPSRVGDVIFNWFD